MCSTSIRRSFNDDRQATFCRFCRWPLGPAMEDAEWLHHGEAGPAWAETRWLYYQVLPARGVALVTGPRWDAIVDLAAGLSASVLSGGPFHGMFPDLDGAVVFVERTGPKAVRGLLDKTLARTPDRFHPRASLYRRAPCGDPTELDDLARLLHASGARNIDQYGAPIRLVVLDLAATALFERDPRQGLAAATVASLDHISMRLDALVVIVGPRLHATRVGDCVSSSLVIDRNARSFQLAKSRESEPGQRWPCRPAIEERPL